MLLVYLEFAWPNSSPGSSPLSTRRLAHKGIAIFNAHETLGSTFNVRVQTDMAASLLTSFDKSTFYKASSSGHS